MGNDFVFYAFNVNGHTAAVFNTSDEALDELSIRLSESDIDEYGIEPIDGIWRLLERMSDFEDRYDDDWMENVVRMASNMISEKKKVANRKKTTPEKTDSKK